MKFARCVEFSGSFYLRAAERNVILECSVIPTKSSWFEDRAIVVGRQTRVVSAESTGFSVSIG